MARRNQDQEPTEQDETEQEETSPNPNSRGQTYSHPAEDEKTEFLNPGIGMEDVPVPDPAFDAEDLNDQVFANKREAWEKANPESVQQNQERDAKREGVSS